MQKMQQRIKPEYMGFWTDEGGYKTPFFMVVGGRGTKVQDVNSKEWNTVDPNTFNGTIEDPYGTSVFDGVQTPDEVSFIKRYNIEGWHQQSGWWSGKITRDPIKYHGRKVDENSYAGTYEMEGVVDGKHHKAKGAFFLQSFPDSPVLEIFFDEMRKKNIHEARH